MYNIITSFPKSGNTWLRFIIFKMYFDDVEFTSQNMETYVPDFHNIYSNNKITFNEKLKGKKIFLKTHLGYDKMPVFDSSKVILILRNPIDVLASIINYYKISDLEIDEVVNEFSNLHTLIRINKKFGFPSWSMHLDSWTKSNKDILIINYNHLLKKFETNLKMICEFLDYQIDEKKIRKIKDETNFLNLTNLENYEKKNNISGFFSFGTSDKKINFMNKGKNGYYSEIFSHDQINKLKGSFNDFIEKYNL